ncbi:MAG TPA: hypothetical protein VFE13_18140 [Caulobacteraceae bacterium]|nr:hypothetical protein [Caulobacteraceae bacterium]
MQIQPIEVYSDATNQVVIRHPGRRFPGLLLQGDSLYSLCARADALCTKLKPGDPAYGDASQLRNALWAGLNHYKSVLSAHGIGLPFSEQPPV